MIHARLIEWYKREPHYSDKWSRAAWNEEFNSILCDLKEQEQEPKSEAEDINQSDIDAVVEELRKATGAHAPMHSAHEGYAVIKEEVDELWEEVRARVHSNARLYTEAKHVAAMALRFMRDVCGSTDKEGA